MNISVIAERANVMRVADTESSTAHLHCNMYILLRAKPSNATSVPHLDNVAEEPVRCRVRSLHGPELARQP